MSNLKIPLQGTVKAANKRYLSQLLMLFFTILGCLFLFNTTQGWRMYGALMVGVITIVIFFLAIFRQGVWKYQFKMLKGLSIFNFITLLCLAIALLTATVHNWPFLILSFCLALIALYGLIQLKGQSLYNQLALHSQHAIINYDGKKYCLNKTDIERFIIKHGQITILLKQKQYLQFPLQGLETNWSTDLEAWLQ
jgi:hypothetical protein